MEKPRQVVADKPKSDFLYKVTALNFKEKGRKYPKDYHAETGGMDLSHILEVDEAYINGLLLEAERLIDLLEMGNLTFGKLRQRDKNLLALYFYFTNPVFYRIIELHVRLPLSSLTLQKPKIDNSLVQDYVFNYFERFMNKTRWKTWLYKMVVYYWLFSEALLLVEDDWKYDREVEVDEEMLAQTKRTVSPEDKDKMQQIVDRYNSEGPDSLTADDLNFVIRTFVFNYNPNYKGMKSARVIDPFKIDEVSYNDEVGINVYTTPKSEFISKYLSEKAFGIGNLDNKEVRETIFRDLKKSGYTRSFIHKNLEYYNEKNLNIVNDPYDDDSLYVAEMGTWDICGTRSSMVSAILYDLLRYFMTCRALDNRIRLSTKKVIICSVDADVAEEQLALLDSRIKEACDASEGAFVSVNYGVNPNEVRFDVRDDLNLEDIREASRVHILVGTGTPETLVTADQTYGSSFLKLEVLNLEFMSFRENLSAFLEDFILKPVAMKRGFVTVDVFGNLKPIYPQINFEVGSIVGQTEFKDMLRDMAAQNIFPTSKLLEFYGFDAEEVFQRMKKDQELVNKLGVNIGTMMAQPQMADPTGGYGAGFDPNQGYGDPNQMYAEQQVPVQQGYGAAPQMAQPAMPAMPMMPQPAQQVQPVQPVQPVQAEQRVASRRRSGNGHTGLRFFED